jgi:PII interaction protein X
MISETYLNHPTFGLLFSICSYEPDRALFSTLYAQRLFFIVTQAASGITFEPTTRNEARLIVESHLRTLRRTGEKDDLDRLLILHKKTFA